jgi:hypothetical protein
MVLLSLIPQLHLWFVRGREWNGAYVSSQGDELLYSAYLNAIIEGRTRKNDPFGGKDDSAKAPLPESIFSIQFIPAYAIALPARVLGASASTAFIVIVALVALLTSLALFCLLKLVTSDNRVAAAGTLFVLCFGCVVGRYGFFGTFVDINVATFPFLRRYQPAVSFPLFFAYQILVWRGLTSENKRDTHVCAVLAGFALAVLVFSYLYLWTASLAWLACICALWLHCRTSDRRKALTLLLIIIGVTSLAIVPYVYMLSMRAATLDEQQILISTRVPDLLRLPEIIGAAVVIGILIGILRKKFDRSDPRVLYAASLSLLPFIVFNQQVLTGKTVQPFHFEIFVVNYSTLVGLLVAVTLFWRQRSDRALLWLGVLSFICALFFVSLPARLLFVPQAVANDLRIPVLLRLKELSYQDGTRSDLRTKGEASTLVFSPSVALIALMPTWTSQGTLLDFTGADCRGMTRQERKRLFQMHLYYSATSITALREALQGSNDDRDSELSGVRTALFGYERTIPALTSQFRPIQAAEIEHEVLAYEVYANSFSRVEALERPLAYAVVPLGTSFDFANLDRWYQRDGGEQVGDYILFRLKLKE